MHTRLGGAAANLGHTAARAHQATRHPARGTLHRYRQVSCSATAPGSTITINAAALPQPPANVSNGVSGTAPQPNPLPDGYTPSDMAHTTNAPIALFRQCGGTGAPCAEQRVVGGMQAPAAAAKRASDAAAGAVRATDRRCLRHVWLREHPVDWLPLRGWRSVRGSERVLLAGECARVMWTGRCCWRAVRRTLLLAAAVAPPVRSLHRPLPLMPRRRCRVSIAAAAVPARPQRPRRHPRAFATT
jgi:hypothetical protein